MDKHTSVSREEVLQQLVKVAEALERPTLTPEQKERGWKKYAELEHQLRELDEEEKSKPVAVHTPVKPVDPADKTVHAMQNIRDILKDAGLKVRRK